MGHSPGQHRDLDGPPPVEPNPGDRHETHDEPPAGGTDAGSRLAEQYVQAVALEASLSEDMAGIIAASAGANADDEHDPEGATIAFERAQIHALLDQAGARLADLRQARARLDEGSYGVCQSCGQQIAAERLEARPATRVCIRCAR